METKPATTGPAAQPAVQASPPTTGAQVTPPPQPAPPQPGGRPLPTAGDEQSIPFGPDGTKRVPMSKIRKRIAATLVEAQRTAAILTTFNEVDMSQIMALRSK